VDDALFIHQCGGKKPLNEPEVQAKKMPVSDRHFSFP